MVALVISGMGIGGLREVGGSKIRSGSKQQRKASWEKGKWGLGSRRVRPSAEGGNVRRFRLLCFLRCPVIFAF